MFCNKSEREAEINNIQDSDDYKSVEEIQADRGSIYGEYVHQANFVGSSILNWIDVAKSNGKEIDAVTLGSMAYIFIKQSRLAVSPEHIDSIKDLASYADLHMDAKA